MREVEKVRALSVRIAGLCDMEPLSAVSISALVCVLAGEIAALKEDQHKHAIDYVAKNLPALVSKMGVEFRARARQLGESSKLPGLP
jgi:hypothetical protein